jgi:DNA polymerase III epsilon subunit-like protein
MLPDLTLIYDTETNGLPFFKQPHSYEGQPYITQLAAGVFDKEGKMIDSMNVYIKPTGWTIPAIITEKTGITLEICEEQGVPIKDALDCFIAMVDQVNLSVAWNEPFDNLLTEAAAHRDARPRIWPGRKTFDLMKPCTNICRLPGRFGFKWPKLTEAHKHFFNEELTGAHDALVDIKGTARIFVHTVTTGLVKLP